MSKRNHPRKGERSTDRPNLFQGKKATMLPVSLYGFDELKRYLESVLGIERVAGLTDDEIRHLANLAHEDLPDVVDDDIATLLDLPNERHLREARTQLAVKPLPKERSHAPSASSGSDGANSSLTQTSFLEQASSAFEPVTEVI
jgi:hypothetical protein